jgi:hypothetical protein
MAVFRGVGAGRGKRRGRYLFSQLLVKGVMNKTAVKGMCGA